MKTWFLGLSIWALGASIAVAEPVVLSSNGNNLSLSIYNGNMALVKDVRKAGLSSGVNEVIFDGVAKSIQPETAIIFGDSIKVREQNYSYNLMSYGNLLQQYIGKEVTAVRIDPEDGKDRYEKAVLLGINGLKPIIQTKNGIDAEFPGRIMFEKMPASLSNKPILAAKLDVNRSGDKNLNLAYLTDGLSWKTDYVANVVNEKSLNLTGWVTINNESGIDYENAKIQLIAGDINIVRAPMVRAHGMMLNKAASFGSFDNSMEAESIEPESINSYELYTLPRTATLKNQQTKQIALIEKNDVTYKKEFKVNSFAIYARQSADKFEKRHPSITYVIENTTDSNLGISLPAGTVRFYQNDKGGNLQFIGASNIKNTAKEDTLRLRLGEAFNISVSGELTKVLEKEISREKQNLNATCAHVKIVRTYNVSLVINNAEDTDNTVIVSQYLNGDSKIVKESIKGKIKDAIAYEWEVSVAKNSKTTLTYTVEVTDRDCL